MISRQNSGISSAEQRFGDFQEKNVPDYLKSLGNSEVLGRMQNTELDKLEENGSDLHYGSRFAVQSSNTECAVEHKMMPSAPIGNLPKKDTGSSKLSIDDMANRVLGKFVLIRHEGNLYYFNGKSYKVLKDEEDLLRITRCHVSRNAFGVSSIKKTFMELLLYLKSDDRLIPNGYERKIQKSQYYIAFQNGVLDVRDLRLHKHSEKRLVFYELDAEWKECDVPRQFDSFLERASGGDVTIRRRILETLGYLLSPINEGKCFFVMGTAPDSGKSTMGEMLERFVGKNYVMHLSTQQVKGRFSLGDIHGKTLNLSMDLPKGKLTSDIVSIIKQITGKDAITVERKYDRLRDVHSNMRFLFASNYPVTISKADDDESFWNRMIVVPFEKSIKKECVDVDLIDKLVLEKNEIISICLQALSGLISRNYEFFECELADQMKRRWRDSDNNKALQTVQQFMEECVVITENPSDEIYSQDIYSAYRKYCDNRQLDSISQVKLTEWMKENLPQCSRKRMHRTGENPRFGFVGMYLKNTRS